MTATTVELFTHPMCSGCQQALTALRNLERAGRLTLVVTSLGSPLGRKRATEVGVSVVPTVRLGTELRLLDGPSDLRTLLAELNDTSSDDARSKAAPRGP
ncbi:MAG: hypothetical protein HY241_00050 [Actinobacteria bacterium]|nr:hypothetical protein [Actinomycetota bacterium]